MTTQAQQSIDAFMKEFTANRENYQKICDKAEELLKTRCKQKGIMAKVNGRVKDAARLREKLINRHEKDGKAYLTVDDVRADLSDLVGLRIALYFPGDAEKIPQVLDPHFKVLRPATRFPEPVDEKKKYEDQGFTAFKRRIYPGYANRRFDGYAAAHYRVHLAAWPVEMAHYPYIEIQVGSLLMHSWSEVEHDLAYKKKMGDVSPEEYACLDELNGLVMAGELALERLNRLSQQRIRDIEYFDTHYTLYAYLSVWMKDNNLGDRDLGHVETLFTAYQVENYLSREAVQTELDRILNLIHEVPEPLADLLLEQFARKDRRSLVKKVLSQAITQANESDGDSITDAQVGKFLGKWNVLEDKLKKALAAQQIVLPRNDLFLRVKCLRAILDEETLELFEKIRRMRNEIVHGYQLPGKMEFAETLEYIEKLRRWVEEKYSV